MEDATSLLTKTVFYRYTWEMIDYSKLYNLCLESYAKIPYIFGGGYAFKPMTLFVELTYRCNFRCEMCQFMQVMEDPRLKDKTGEELTADEIKSAIDDVSRLGIIMFTGGEPLLRHDIIDLITYACKQHKSYLVTNGILLKEGIAKELVKLGCGNIFSHGVASVGVSLEAMGSRHDHIVKADGSFDKIVANVKRMVELKKETGKKYPLVALKCVMTNSNIDQLEEMYRLAEEIGVDIFNPITLYNIPSTDRFDMDFKIEDDHLPEPIEGIDTALLKEQIANLRKCSKGSPLQVRITPPGISDADIVSIYENNFNLSNKVCYSPWSSVALSAYGEVFPCSNYSVGNIRDGKTFLQLWNNKKMRRFRLGLKERGVYKVCTACCSITKRD